MEYYYFGGILVLVLIGLSIQKLKEFKSPYYRIRKKLTEDLVQANFAGDWHSRQEINLKLLWLEIVKETEGRGFLGNRKDDLLLPMLSKLSEKDLAFPISWKLDDDRVKLFAEKIIREYGRVLAESKYKGMYKPDNILPLPKSFIKKSIFFILDYGSYNSAPTKFENKDQLFENLNTQSRILNSYFVDTGDEDLPMETLGNMEKGKQFYDKQPKMKDEEKSLEWRN